MSAINTSNGASDIFGQALSSQTGGSELGKDDFLQLLVTQFQYQDPLNPMEDKEFIAQLAQFSSLEQLMNLNTSMQGLTMATYSQEMINATSYIGKAVDVSGTSISKETDMESKESTISMMRYAIGEPSVSGIIKIFDSSGGLVASYPRPAEAAGTHEFEWDGKNSFGGIAPDGVYNIVPEFLDAEGKRIQYDSTVDGIVSGVTSSGGLTYLYLSDGRTTPLSEVRRVSEPNVIDGTGGTDPDDGTDGTDPDDGTDGTNPDDGTDGTKPDDGTGDKTTKA